LKPQVSIKEQVSWFEWDVEVPFDPYAINEAVNNASLATFEFQIIGEVTFKDGVATVTGLEGVKITYEGDPPKDGKHAIEIVGFDNEGGALSVYKVAEHWRPKVYQP